MLMVTISLYGFTIFTTILLLVGVYKEFSPKFMTLFFTISMVSFLLASASSVLTLILFAPHWVFCGVLIVILLLTVRG
jgi:hypothetical protein